MPYAIRMKYTNEYLVHSLNTADRKYLDHGGKRRGGGVLIKDKSFKNAW